MYEIEKFLIFRLLVLFLALWFAAFVGYTLIFGLRDPITNAIVAPDPKGHVSLVGLPGVNASTGTATYFLQANNRRVLVPLPAREWSFAGERSLLFPGSSGSVVQAIFTKRASTTRSLGDLHETAVVEIFPADVRAADISVKPNLYAQSFFDRCVSSGTSALSSTLFESHASECQDPATGGPFSLYALEEKYLSTPVVRTWYYATEESEHLSRNYRPDAQAFLRSISVQ